MMMKKLIKSISFLLAIFLTLSFFGCGKNQPANENNEPNSQLESEVEVDINITDTDVNSVIDKSILAFESAIESINQKDLWTGDFDNLETIEDRSASFMFQTFYYADNFQYCLENQNIQEDKLYGNKVDRDIKFFKAYFDDNYLYVDYVVQESVTFECLQYKILMSGDNVSKIEFSYLSTEDAVGGSGSHILFSKFELDVKHKTLEAYYGEPRNNSGYSTTSEFLLNKLSTDSMDSLNWTFSFYFKIDYSANQSNTFSGKFGECVSQVLDEIQNLGIAEGYEKLSQYDSATLDFNISDIFESIPTMTQYRFVQGECLKSE